MLDFNGVETFKYIYIYIIRFRCLQKHLAECSMDIQSIIK